MRLRINFSNAQQTICGRFEAELKNVSECKLSYTSCRANFSRFELFSLKQFLIIKKWINITRTKTI